MGRRSWVLGALLALGCAGAPVKKGPEMEALPTSVELLLERSAELNLTADQVEKLQAIGRDYEHQTQPVFDELQALRMRPVEHRPAPRPDANAPRGIGFGSGLGASKGKKGMADGMDDLGSIDPRGDKPPAPDETPEERARAAKLESLHRVLDGYDDEAYRRAEELLTEAQKPAARKLIGKRNAERDRRERAEAGMSR